MKQFEDLKNTIIAAEEDAVKFFSKGNAAAGTRLRQKMQAIKSLAQGVRIDVQNAKNGGQD